MTALPTAGLGLKPQHFIEAETCPAAAEPDSEVEPTRPRQPAPVPTADTVSPANATHASGVTVPPDTSRAEWMTRVAFMTQLAR